MWIGAVTVVYTMGALQRNENRTIIQFSNSTSVYLSEENENTNLKIYMHSYVYYIYATEYFSAIKNNGILPFVTTLVDLGDTMLSEMSLTERKTNTVKFHLYMRSK